jgi:WD40 repeat protein
MALVVGPDGKVFSGSVDGTIRVWSGASGAQLHTLKTSMRSIYALALGRDGTLYTAERADLSRNFAIDIW